MKRCMYQVLSQLSNMNKIIERKDFNWTVLKVANILCDRTVYASWKRLKGLLKPCTYEKKYYIAERFVTLYVC